MMSEEFDTIRKIVKQLESGDYKDVNGNELVNSQAFIE